MRAVKALLFVVLALAACGGSRNQICGSSADCPAPLTCQAGQCVSSGFCVGSSSCAQDSQCGSGLHCANGCCVPGTSGSCARDADCSAHPTTPVCDTAHETCVACLSASDCGAGKLCQNQACVALKGCGQNSDCTDATAPVCDVAHRACVQCLKQGDCTSPALPVCDGTHQCVAGSQCTADPQCSKPTPRCQVSSGHCVACLTNVDCPQPLVCDPKQLVCLQPAATGCTVDKDCASNPAAPHCKPAASGGSCVACTADGQCPAGQICDVATNACAVKQCGVDTDCASPTPRCDLGDTPHLCVACLASADCPNGGTCQPDHTCQAPANFCNVDQDCATNVAGPHCKTAAHSCVACLTATDCGAGKTCTAQNTCVTATCTADGDCSALPKTPHCNTASGSCVQCTTAAQCGAGFRCDSFVCKPVCTAATQAQDCSVPTPVCKESAAGNACVQCVQSSDCTGGQICSNNNVCVTPQLGCPATACPPTTPVCNTNVSPGSCVQCLANSDCRNGAGCDPAALTCTQTGAEGEICGVGDACNAGLLCINEGGANGAVCRVQCNPYAPSCASTKVCSWIGFDPSGAFIGDCIAPNGKAHLGAACDPRLFDSCEWNLLCAPTTSTTGVCAAVCDPTKATCGSGTCNGIIAAGGPLSFGYCGPASKWGKSCTTDTSAGGPDCGDALSKAGTTGLYCAPSFLIADQPPLANVLPICSYTPVATTAKGGANASCAANFENDCRTGACLRDGPLTCFSGCATDADCARDGGNFCFDTNFATSAQPNDVPSCAPTCRADADCAALGSGGLGRTCAPLPTRGGSSWQASCKPVAGTGKPGVKCRGDSDCETGKCITAATIEGIELGLSVAGFSATDGFCFGACQTASDCATPGTACDPYVALPLAPRDTGDKGVAGWPNYAVCWPQAGCLSNADCAGFSLDSATPRVCAPYKLSERLSTDGAASCKLDTDCPSDLFSGAAGICNSTVNNPNPAQAFGSNAGIYGPNGKCRAVSWALECAPSLGAVKGKPGVACTHNADCQTGHCIGVAGGASVCFGGCVTSADCATGSTCKSTTYLGMSVSACLP